MKIIPRFVFVFDENDQTLVFEFLDPCPSALADLIANDINKNLVKGQMTWTAMVRRKLDEYAKDLLQNLAKQNNIYQLEDKTWAYKHPTLGIEFLAEKK